MPVNLKILCATSALVGLVFAAGDGQAATNRQAPISLFNGVDEIVFACKTSATFVDIPGLSRTFTQGAGAAEEVIVMLQGAFSMLPFDEVYAQLLIDNVVQSPGTVPLTGSDQFGSTHGFNWQSKPLSPGVHTARVQWRTDLGSEMCVDARSLIILHK